MEKIIQISNSKFCLYDLTEDGKVYIRETQTKPNELRLYWKEILQEEVEELEKPAF